MQLKKCVRKGQNQSLSQEHLWDPALELLDEGLEPVFALFVDRVVADVFELLLEVLGLIWTETRMEEWRGDGWMDGWKGWMGWMGWLGWLGWMDGWMDGWTDGWMDV